MSSITTSLTPSSGFHPHLHLSIPQPALTRRPRPTCSLYTLTSVPPSFIIDRYQLYQLHREGKLGLQHDGGTSFEVQGEGDLERGVGSNIRGAALLLRLDDRELESAIEVDVPLHMRYQIPSKEGSHESKFGMSRKEMGKVTVSMEEPRVFWACQNDSNFATTSSIAPPCSPSSLSPSFSFASLSNSTLHYVYPSDSCTPPLAAATTSTNLTITLPTGIQSDLAFVAPITISIVWIALLFLLRTSWKVAMRNRTTSTVEDGKKRQ